MRAATCLLLTLLGTPLLAAQGDDDRLAALPQKYREWLALVDILITDEERDYFLSLERDFRRKAFIEAFWEERDPFDDTRFNELRTHWDERAARALSEYGRLDDDRARVLLLNGEPINACRHATQELEVWFYDGSEKSDRQFVLLFEKPGVLAPYRLWRPNRLPLRRLGRRQIAEAGPIERCSDGTIEIVLEMIGRELDYERLLDEVLAAPKPRSSEWVATFASLSTGLPRDAATFDAALAFDFPGRHQQRTVVQGMVTIPRSELAAPAARRDGVHRFLITGEVVRPLAGGPADGGPLAGEPRDEELFERFRFRFEVPAAEAAGPPAAGGLAAGAVPLVFQRYLRPGRFAVLVKVEDLFGHRFAHLEVALDVPELAGADETPALQVSELFRLLAEADAATARGERIVRLLQPAGVVQTGLVRFKTLTVGELDKVTFFLDDQPILTKNRPPYSVELDLGDLPGTHRLRVLGFDAAGAEVATDEILLNPGGQRFRVRLVEPLAGRAYRGSLRAVADVQVPDGEVLDRLELYLNEELVATLYQPPWVQPIVLRGDDLAYVRAVGHLADGNSSEELVFFNTPDFFEKVEVRFVELYATVHDRDGRPVPGLGKDAFAVVEDGRSETIRRFEWVSDLPIHTVLLIDNSSSMEDRLETVAAAARAFVEQTIQPKDRASLITFTAQPDVAVRFTNDVPALSAALAAMRAEGGTALYDSLVFALHYFHGIRGQKALLLLSDGKDEASTFDFDGALEYARRAGVTIYAIGLKEASLHRGARRVLRELADETGGRSFFVEDVGELAAIYTLVQQELRSQYLIAYQSSSTRDPSEFRTVTLTAEAGGEKLEVRTMSGYYP